MIDPAIDFQAAFEAMPGNFVILKPDSPDFTILAVSNELLRISSRKRQDVVGKSVFEVFPENPEAATATGPSTLRTSIQNAFKYKKYDQMPPVRYDVTGASGPFEERYWSASNKPVLDSKGEVAYVIHSTTDITEQFKSRKQNDELNRKLEEEVKVRAELTKTQNALKQFNSELEERVEERTIAVKLAQVETQRQVDLLHELFMQAPAPIAILEGENMMFRFVNPAYQQIFPERELKGKGILEALPELKNTSLKDHLEKVYQKGETFVAHEMPFMLARQQGEPLEELYFNFTLQARRNQLGEIDGILFFAYEVTEQVTARKKIEESEHQLRSIIESSPFPVGVFYGKEMRIQFANKAIKDGWGKGPDVVGKLFRDVLPELQNQAVFEELERVFDTGIPFHSRHNPLELLINGQLQTFYFNYSFTPLFNAEGEVYGVINSGADDTELILAQRRVEESESRFRSMIEQAPVAIGLTRGKDHFIEKMNAPMLRITGKNREEVVGKNLTEAMPDIKDDSVLKVLNTVLETGKGYSGNEVPFTYKLEEKLELHYLNVSYTPLFEEGKVTGIIHVAVDVTKEVTARKEIEESQEALKRFKFMADQARDAFVLMREDGSFAYLNPKALEAWAYSEEEVQRLRVPNVDPVYQEQLFLQLFSRAQQETIPRFETIHRRKDGEIFPVEVTVAGLKLEDEPYLFAIARDITEHKKAEETLKLKNEQLLRINNDLDNFIYTASHDLKAPITNIEGLVQVLLRNLPAEALALKRVQQIIDMMQESVERFKKTVEGLTDVVKLQKEHSGELIPVDLATVVQEVQLDLEPLIRESGVILEIDVPDCFSIRFSEKNLRSVVYNLLSNAIKYRSQERKPRVEISCESSSKYDMFVVKDNGVGIRKRSLDQLFTMFKRFHSNVEGTGIGLYMVKKMVKNAGGHIEVESQEGEGTTFRVFFPR